MTGHRIYSVFLAGYTSLHERYDIDIYTQRTTKLFTPIIKSFVALKVLIQNERTRWFTARTLRRAFVQGIVRVGYSPLFFYYELLVMHSYQYLDLQWDQLYSSNYLHVAIYLIRNIRLYIHICLRILIIPTVSMHCIAM